LTAVIVKKCTAGRRNSRDGGDSPAATAAIQALSINPPDAYKQVLVVDDQEPNCQMLSWMFRKLGYEHVDLVCSGFEALGALDRRAYDIIILDINMPNMTGLQCAQLMRQRWPSTYIVGCTACKDTWTLNDCLKAGINALLLKPVTLTSLHDTLAKADPFLAALETYRNQSAPPEELEYVQPDNMPLHVGTVSPPPAPFVQSEGQDELGGSASHTLPHAISSEVLRLQQSLKELKSLMGKRKQRGWLQRPVWLAWTAGLLFCVLALLVRHCC